MDSEDSGVAERASGKAKRASQRVSAADDRASSRRVAHVGATDSQSDAAVATERDALRAELDTARRRIAELEQQREEIVNRIDWIIDSLHNLLEEER